MFLFDWFWDLLSYFGWVSDAKILIIGLANAGKSLLLLRLASARTLHLPPTNQLRCKGLPLESLSCTDHEIGVPRQVLFHPYQTYTLAVPSTARQDWRSYFHVIHGIIFIVDAADAERFPEARAELETFLHDDTISDVPIVVLANKVDRKEAVEMETVRDAVCVSICRTEKNLANNTELPGRPIEIFPCSVKNMIGYYEGIRWLADCIKAKKS